jgi:hypothetical protein
MKQKTFVFTLILMIVAVSFKLNAQSNFAPKTGMYTGSDSDRVTYRYMFEENNKISYWRNVTRQKSGTYTIDDSSGVSFINIQWNNNTKERFLFLMSDDFLCFYDSDNFPVFFGYYYNTLYQDIRSEEVNKLASLKLEEFENVTASRSLIENGINYSPTPGRLGLHINRAWAVRGGVGESLYGEARWDTGYGGNVDDQLLYISSGYVSYSKPHLYHENSRPQKIRIYDINNRAKFQDFILLDTPNFQIVDVSNFTREPSYDTRDYQHHVKIRIEILEIYPGTTYNDMCVNSIIFFKGDYR